MGRKWWFSVCNKSCYQLHIFAYLGLCTVYLMEDLLNVGHHIMYGKNVTFDYFYIW